jgi:hypothetical protein
LGSSAQVAFDTKARGHLHSRTRICEHVRLVIGGVLVRAVPAAYALTKSTERAAEIRRFAPAIQMSVTAKSLTLNRPDFMPRRMSSCKLLWRERREQLWL